MLSYFLKTDAVDKIESGSCYAVIGRKGSGKTALTKYFSQPRKNYLSSSPTLRDYPWGIHAKRRNLGASDIESYVSSWRYLIAVKANSTILEKRGMRQMSDSQRAAREFLNENYGGISPSLADILRPAKLKITKGIVSPSLFGNSIGAVEIENERGGVSQEIDIVTDALLKNASTLLSQANLSGVAIHFDELDQGLSELDTRRREMLIGLILAVRSIRSGSHKSVILPVFYIRTDLWDKLRFSDKNKITQSSMVSLEWNSESLLQMMNERIKAKLGQKMHWDDLEDKQLMRGSQTKWNHIIARTFLRPRDVIQFFNYALAAALEEDPNADIFLNEDIQNAREPYSRYLKQELDDEVAPHWPQWGEALQACSQVATMTMSREAFAAVYETRKSKENPYDTAAALEKLYEYSIIGYRRGVGKGGSGWTFQYADPDAGWDNASTRFKVHTGLKEYAKLREERVGK